MSFGWNCKGKRGVDLFAKYGVNRQALGLGPNNAEATPAPHSVVDIRRAWMDIPFKEDCRNAAILAVATVQAMARENMESLTPKCHCPTCTCPQSPTEPRWWSVQNIQALLSVPLEEVYRADGGY